MIQSMGGNTLPTTFDVVVRAENSLIQAGKIAPRPPMPIFADLQPIIPIVPPVIVVVPSFPTYNSQVAAQEHVVPSHLQEIISIKEQNANLQKTLQNFSNELVNIKKTQTQPPYQIPFQAPYQASYQPNSQGQRRNFNQRPFQQYNLNTPSSSREIVPVQNNLAVDYEWFFPCNQSHNQSTCSNGVLNQALMVQNSVVVPRNQSQEVNEQQSAPMEHDSPDVTLMNWQGEELCGVNQPQNQSYIPVVANTRSKKRAVDMGQQTNKNNNQPFSSTQAQARSLSAQNTQILQRSQLVVTKDQPKSQPQLAQIQKDIVATKGQQKISMTDFNILDQLKKTHVSVSMWDSLFLPGQKDLLHDTLSNHSLTAQPSNQ